MTHFVGLVVAETEGEIAALVQPFHEYECTGTDDQYVVDVDMTAEARAEFAKDTTKALRDAAGALHSFFTPEGNWDPRFSQPDKQDSWDPTRRTYYAPPGYTEVEVPTSELESFEKWAPAYYGAEMIGEKLIKRTNPNAKWDWWVVGGRWKEMVPGNTCKVEAIPQFFTDWTPKVLVDAEGWHEAAAYGWFGFSKPTDTPEAVSEKMTQHAGKRVWVVDFHI